MSRREILQNNTSDTLSASCTNVATTITVTTGSKFPASGDFHVLVDTEIMLVTARSTNTLTVTRGVEGTTAAAHSNAAVITLILTAASLKAYLRDNVPGADGSKPAMRLVDSSGNPLTSSNYTVLNTSTSTITDSDGRIILRKAGPQGASQDLTGLARSYTAPATVIGALRFCHPNVSGFPGAGIGFYDIATSKLQFHFAVNSSGLLYQLLRFTSPTASDTQPIPGHPLSFVGDTLWFKCEDDGTNVKFSIGEDGANWIQVLSESRLAYMPAGPTHFFWGANNYSGTYDILTSLVSWVEG